MLFYKHTQMGTVISVFCAEQCERPQDPGACNNFSVRFWHNPESQQCRAFRYAGCDGNSNNFATFDDCANTCGVCPIPSCAPGTNCQLGFKKTRQGCLTCDCLGELMKCSVMRLQTNLYKPNKSALHT